MLTREEVRFVREQVAPHVSPVLSLYVDIDPSKPENARKGWLLRVKNSLKDLSLPAGLEKRVVGLLEEERPQARTLVLFAAEDLLERYDLQVELPVVDLAHGRVDARWGEPYVTPLLYALDEYERAGVLLIEQRGWRFFEVFLREIEEVTDIFATVAPEEWSDLKNYLPTIYEDFLKKRLPTHPDKFPRRLEAWVHRFFKHLAEIVEDVAVKRGIGRLVLLGPEEETKFFEQFLSRNMRRRVIGHVHNLPSPNGSPAQVFEKVKPTLEAAEREHEQNLLKEIENRPGIWGLDPTLDALQTGWLGVLVAPWNIEARVWRCPAGWVGGTREVAQALCPDEEPQEVPLRDLIVDLAAGFGARLEFVRGEAETRLLERFGGLAGLPR